LDLQIPEADVLNVSGDSCSHTSLITHFADNGHGGVYASDLNAVIATFAIVPMWEHRYTHIRRKYKIGATDMLVSRRGFDARDPDARAFAAAPIFEVLNVPELSPALGTLGRSRENTLQ
jgi:hypothetical protein